MTSNFADGLGSRNEGDRGERQRCRRDGGEVAGAHGRDAGPSCRHVVVGADGSDDEGNGDEGTSAPTASPPFLSAHASAPVPPCLRSPPSSAWGRVRRVYRELVMLRDTLRARLWATVSREAKRSRYRRKFGRATKRQCGKSN